MPYPLNNDGVDDDDNDDVMLYIDYVQTPSFYTNILSERLLYAKPQIPHLRICSLINSSP